jgi:hypothetical protein
MSLVKKDWEDKKESGISQKTCHLHQSIIQSAGNGLARGKVLVLLIDAFLR